MKANLSLAKGLTEKSYYLIINNIFHLKISKSMFYEIAKFLNIKVEE